MPIVRLDIQHCRNIESARLQFSPGLNLITGLNASGKTSLLEAIALVVAGKSFRTPRIEHLVQHGQDEMVLLGEYRQGSESYRVGMSRHHRKTQVKLNGAFVTRTTDLVGYLPLFVLTPESHQLLDSGPKMRRQYLDWGVFHVEHRYLESWQRYHRILRQRNATLRQQSSAATIKAWDSPLVEYALQLHEFRQAYLDRLQPWLHEFCLSLLGLKVDLHYQPGWETDSGLAQNLIEQWDKDLARGFTSLGPHRADLKLKYAGKTVQSVFSRGQQKLLICAMTLAQMRVLERNSLILVDDLPAELDPLKRQTLMEALQSTGAQIMVTATESGLIQVDGWPERKMFHVEHGEVREVV